MSCFLKTLSGEKTSKVPVWLMRQAGRYLPEYRDIRKDVPDFLSLVYTPDLAAEVTLQPLRRFDLDAAILFSDILVIPDVLGQYVRFVKGEGPQLNAIKYPQEIGQLTFDAQKLSPITETIKKIKQDLTDDKALIGFAGSPWTVACYMVQGHGKSDFPKAQDMMRDHAALFKKLIDKITAATCDYLIMQIESGVDALQLFDSWAGLLKEQDFQNWVINPTQKIVAQIKQKYPTIPIIGFARDSQTELIDYGQKTGIQALGLSQEIDLNWADQAIPKTIVLQGNLDPNLLLKGGEEMVLAVKKICDTMRHRPFVFNLGHGVIKETPPDHITQLINTIREIE